MNKRDYENLQKGDVVMVKNQPGYPAAVITQKTEACNFGSNRMYTAYFAQYLEGEKTGKEIVIISSKDIM